MIKSIINSKNRLALLVAAAFVAVTAIGGINAYLIAQSSLTNEIDIGNSDVSIVEDVTFPW